MFLNNVVNYIHDLSTQSKLLESENSNIEIEIKFLLDKRIKIPYGIQTNQINYTNQINLKTRVMGIVQNALKYGTLDISQTINFINTNDNGMFVKQLYFTNGIQDKDKKNYYFKKSLVAPFYMGSDNISYKFTINMETSKQTDINMFDITRFRLRYTIIFNTDGFGAGWKLDLTFVKETRDASLSVLKTIRDKMFSKQIPIQNLLNEFDWDYPDRIELELEYIDDIKNFNISSIVKVLDGFKQFELPNSELILNSNITNLELISGEKTKTEKSCNNIKYMAYENCINEIAQILKPKLIDKFKSGQFGLKQLGSNPVELNKNLYVTKVLPNIQNFMVTEKIDGIRSMIIIYPNNGVCYIINNKNKDGFSIKSLTPSITSNSIFANVSCIILDSEAIDSKYYIFDVIKYEVNLTPNHKINNVHEMPFKKRLEYIKIIVDNANELLIDNEPFLFAKHFIELTTDSYMIDIKTFYNDMLQIQNYSIDGLIIISKNDNYDNTLNYKWKPVITIDFVAKQCPNDMLGILPYIIKPNKTLYLLFCGIRSIEYKQWGIERFKLYDQIFPNVCVNKYGKTNDSYIPIQFAPSADPYAYLFWSDNDALNDKVIELSYDNNEWIFLKVRHDRVNDLNRKTYYGNNFKVAEQMWMNYKNPLTLDIVCSAFSTNNNIGNNTDNKLNLISNSNSYFKKESTEYVAMRKFNNYVKKEIISSITQFRYTEIYQCVIELASGKGQDLQKYIDCGFQKILMTDIDIDALSEIINRKHKYISNINSNNVHRNTNKFKMKKEKQEKTCTNACSKIYIKQLNLLDCYKKNTELIYNSQYGVPLEGSKLVVCNLALHYIIPNKLKSQNFVNFLNKILATDGIFIFTSFNGEKIFKLLELNANSDGIWNKYNNAGKLLYSIKKKYKGVFTGSNQQIGVLLPFTDGEYYTENLININVLNAQLEKKKIKLIANESFETYLDKFSVNKTNFYKQLNDIDKEYISLYHFYIYKKF
jgi:SAM-dependent methyltransferase